MCNINDIKLVITFTEEKEGDPEAFSAILLVIFSKTKEFMENTGTRRGMFFRIKRKC